MNNQILNCLILMVFSVALIPIAFADGISSVRMEDYSKPGTEFPVQITLPVRTEWHGWIIIPDLGIVERVRHAGTSRQGRGYVYLPETVPPGEYLVRVQVRKQDKDSQEDALFRHRWIYVE